MVASTHRRVARTKAHVLSVALSLLPEVGPIGLTYTVLADRAHVTRQTLYRHWPTREQLFAELVLQGPDVSYPAPGTDAEEVVSEFLASLRAGMDDPPTAAALSALVSQADREPASTAALAAIAVDRWEALNTLLAPSGCHVTADEFARLCGPILFQRFFARLPASDQLIQNTVRAWQPRAHPRPAAAP